MGEFHTRPSGAASRRPGRGERGQNLVEFALVVPVFFVLLFGIVDFGLGLKAWITITNSAREAARFGAVTCATDQANTANVVSRAVSTSAGLLTAADVTVTNCPGGSTESVVVSVTHGYNLITPLGGLLTLIGGGATPATLNLSSSADMRLE